MNAPLNRHTDYSRGMAISCHASGGGHSMSNNRLCTRCKQRKPQKGGTNRNGQGFVCADCKPKAVQP